VVVVVTTANPCGVGSRRASGTGRCAGRAGHAPGRSGVGFYGAGGSGGFCAAQAFH
jgi:hypothetical protein